MRLHAGRSGPMQSDHRRRRSGRRSRSFPFLRASLPLGRRQKRVRPCAFFFRQGAARLLQCVLQHIPPPCRIVESNTHSVLYESGNVCRLPGRNQRPNFPYLALAEGYGHLCGRHTKYHTTRPGRFQKIQRRRCRITCFDPQYSLPPQQPPQIPRRIHPTPVLSQCQVTSQ
jgi:hypothetical protein